MKKVDKSAASYLDTIGSGFESKTVEEGKPQIGKAHEEEVASKNNWESDERDPLGRAAPSKKAQKLARKLRRIAAELEAFTEEYMEEEYAKDICETQEEMKEQVDEKEASTEVHGNCWKEIEAKMSVSEVHGNGWKEIEKKLSSHPLVNPDDKPEGLMDSRTGDEWFDVTIEDWKNDKRDTIGKPVPAKT
jgi:hypothetical protein